MTDWIRHSRWRYVWRSLPALPGVVLLALAALGQTPGRIEFKPVEDPAASSPQVVVQQNAPPPVMTEQPPAYPVETPSEPPPYSQEPPPYSQTPIDPPVTYDAEPGMTIRSITFSGLENVTEAYARSLIQSETETPYDPVLVVEDIRRLERSGKFESVVAVPDVDGGQVDLVFEVVERPAVVAIEIEGNQKFKRKELLKDIPISVGDPLDRVSVQQGLSNIESRYREAGYGSVEVTLDEAALENEQVIRITIVEGPRIRVRAIRFEGNDSFSDNTLRSKVQTKTYIWVFRTGAYDPDRVQDDEISLRQFYSDQGYLEARTSHRLEFDDSGENLTVIFIIDEGIQFRLRNIYITGAEAVPEAEIRAKLSLTEGDVFRGDKLRNDVKAIQDYYGEQGFIYARVSPSWVYAADEPELVDLTFEVNEDASYKVGRVIVRGNSRTKDKVVRREVLLYPEDTFDLSAVQKSEQRLRETSIFDEASITPVGDDPYYRDALVAIVESDRTVKFLIGAGVTSDSGVIGNFSIEHQNFDLFDWPRSFGELFSGQSFTGAGQTLRIQFEPSTDFTRARIDFFEPYFLDRPISFGTGFYLFERDRDDWKESRLGINVSFGKRFERGWLKGWAGEVALRTEWVDVSDVGRFAARDIREDEGRAYISSVKGTLVRDRTDSRFLPTRGDRLKMSWEQFGVLGGEATMAKVIGSYNWYKTLRTDVFDRKSVLQLRGLAGFIIGNAPIYERFYAGGIGSLRGFAFRTVTPRQGIGHDEIGGEFMLLTGAEYTFPLVGDNIRGVLFSDMGTVESNIQLSNWRVSVGAGLRVLRALGPVPLEFDFAVPLATAEYDDEQVFSFFIGTTF